MALPWQRARHAGPVRRGFGAWAGALGLAAVSLVLGCAGMVEPGRGAHGNLAVELARAPVRIADDGATPTVLLIERGGVRAIDPELGKQRWAKSLHVTGHPVAGADTVYLPVRGHRLVAVDRRSGVARWSVRLPGEALTGLAVGDGVVLATVVDGDDRARSRLVALSSEDATIRWQRRSGARFGVPAARRRVVIVPLEDKVVAFRLSSGKEVARVALDQGTHRDGDPALERLGVHDEALVLGGGNRFVNLLTASGGQAPAPQRIDTGFGWVFEPIEGLDPGHDDTERLRLAVRFNVSGDAPRGAVLLARRAVIAMRLDPTGRPVHARWVHKAADRREFVAMDVGPQRVTLVREDGSIVLLDARDGSVQKRYAGRRPTRGALMIGLSFDRGPGKTANKPGRSTRQLIALLRDDDPRLAPAQTLAADLLWRGDDLEARAIVEQIAEGSVTVGTGDAAAAMQVHALGLVTGPWGDAPPEELAARLATLSDRPSYLADRTLHLAPLARAAVHSGNQAMVPHLVAHLLHPATAASDLAEIAGALCELGGTSAEEGLALFVRRYHADPEVVYESRALHVAVDHLARVHDERGAAESATGASGGQHTLVEALRDPFTVPGLRAYIAARVPLPAPSPAAAEPKPASPPLDKTRDDRDSGRIPPVHATLHSAGL